MRVLFVDFGASPFVVRGFLLRTNGVAFVPRKVEDGDGDEGGLISNPSIMME